MTYYKVDDATSLARNQLGVLYKYSGKFEKGEKLYRDALKNLIDRHGESNSLVALLYHNLDGLFHGRGDFAEGEPYARKAWDINRQLLGNDHSCSAWVFDPDEYFWVCNLTLCENFRSILAQHQLRPVL
jgi:hypothetical protein